MYNNPTVFNYSTYFKTTFSFQQYFITKHSGGPYIPLEDSAVEVIIRKLHKNGNGKLIDKGILQYIVSLDPSLSLINSIYARNRAHLRALEALAFLTLKYSFSHFSWNIFFKIFNVHLCGYSTKYLFQHERF